MKKLAIITLLFLNLSALETITISKQQQLDLGIKVQKSTSVKSIEYTPFNARVILDKKDLITINSNVESIVKALHVSELEHVKEGQRLLTLKSNALLTLQREYIEAILESKSSSQNYERDKKLQADGIISQKRLLETLKKKVSAEVKVKLNSNQLLTNGFSKAMLLKVAKTDTPIVEQIIYAPKSGLIDKIDVNIGEYIQPHHTIMKIYADGKRYIEMSIPLRIADELTIEDICRFSNYSANITAIGKVVNTPSQSVEVRAEIKNAQDIMINRIYEATIYKSVSDALKIKKTALVFENGEAFVFKKVATGFVAVDVEIISEGAAFYIVKSNLEDGDELAVSATAALLSAMEGEDE